MLTTKEAAVELGFRLDYMYRLLATNIIAGHKADGEWRIPASEIESYRENHWRKFGRKAAE